METIPKVFKKGRIICCSYYTTQSCVEARESRNHWCGHCISWNQAQKEVEELVKDRLEFAEDILRRNVKAKTLKSKPNRKESE